VWGVWRRPGRDQRPPTTVLPYTSTRTVGWTIVCEKSQQWDPDLDDAPAGQPRGSYSGPLVCCDHPIRRRRAGRRAVRISSGPYASRVRPITSPPPSCSRLADTRGRERDSRVTCSAGLSASFVSPPGHLMGLSRPRRRVVLPLFGAWPSVVLAARRRRRRLAGVLHPCADGQRSRRANGRRGRYIPRGFHCSVSSRAV